MLPANILRKKRAEGLAGLTRAAIKMVYGNAK
jgi:hypothetical protein